ncbi:unnamed protein product [Moneuplotes crassus]|uniref:Uncharacterized protein n=1 Tax=Euplotes crassus TaxID=5936 RepID=A0AAD1XXV9_EUPCR|nr:unnamed protein product [Moneuplotes crassus]
MHFWKVKNCTLYGCNIICSHPTCYSRKAHFRDRINIIPVISEGILSICYYNCK